MALILRKRSDGSVVSDGDLPDSHQFPSGWLEDAVGRGIANVTITLNVDDEPVEYRFTGYRRVGKNDRVDTRTLLADKI
jgi:hypothetical protein